MSSQTSVDRFSTVADFELLAAGRSYSVAQVAPEFLILEQAADIPPGPATLIIRAEGRELHRSLHLLDGASRSSTRVRIVRQ